MDLSLTAKSLHSLRVEKSRGLMGRPFKLLTKTWEELSEEEVQTYLTEVEEVVEALERGGIFVSSYNDLVVYQRRTNPLKVVRKDTGRLEITGG